MLKVKEIKDIILKSNNKELKEFVNKHFENKRSGNEIMNHLKKVK